MADASMGSDGKGKVNMEATDKSGKTHKMSGDGKSGKTQISTDGSVVQTDGDQDIYDD